MISRRESSASGVGGHTSLGEGWILISRRGSHTLLLEDQGGVCFDLKEGSSSSEVGGDTLVGRGCIEGPTTERNIVGVAHFYACANPLTLLLYIQRMR